MHRGHYISNTMEIYGSLIFDYCTEMQCSRRSARIMTRQNKVLNPDAITQETTSNDPQENPKKRRRKPKSKLLVRGQTKNSNKFPTKDKDISIIQPSKVAASMRKIPEKILHIDYETKEILIKWKHLTAPEYLDRTKSIPPDVLALILEFKSNPAPNKDAQGIPEKEIIKVQKTATSIAEYRREQRFAMPENFKHVTCHIKTE